MHGFASQTAGRQWPRFLVLGTAASMSLAFVVFTTRAQELSAPPAPAPLEQRSAVSEEQVEVLTRGPVHEAFAEPMSAEPQPSLIVPKKPPEDIDEVAPDFKPEGDDVIWIPGYWAWDDDRDDFLWISGIWRKLPPGQRWIPGHWMETTGGWQWIAGLWAPDQQEELVYRKPPPQSLDVGPSTPAPNDSHFWVPGCWMWYDIGYRWRPGYWHPYQADWIWVPAHWVWTPNGCLFVAGYWDYRVSARGQLFAPVYFQNRSWIRTRYYSPWCVVDSTPLLIHLWVRPRYCHYYFGDYYGPRYASWGLSPWSHSLAHRGHWDPLLAHYQAHYRHHDHIDYADRMRHWHSYYESHEDKRPRHTFRDQDQFAQAHPDKNSVGVQQAVLATPLAIVAKRTDNVVPMKPVTQEKKKAYFDDSRHLRELTREREHMEKLAKFDQPRTGADDLKNGLRPESGDRKTKSDGKGRTNFGDGDNQKSPDAGKTKDQFPSTATIDSKRDGSQAGDVKKERDRDRVQQPSGGSVLKLPKLATTTQPKSTPQSSAVPSQFGAANNNQPRTGPNLNRGQRGAPVIPSNDQPNRASEKFDRNSRHSTHDEQNQTNSPRNNNTIDPRRGKSIPADPKGLPRIESPKVETPSQPRINTSRPPAVEQPTIQQPKPPRVEQPKSEQPKHPKMEQPKPQPPRTEQLKPRIEQPKPPKAEQPSSPKLETPKRSSTDNSSRRSESKRTSDERKPKSDRK